jgi:hypothetical protein
MLLLALAGFLHGLTTPKTVGFAVPEAETRTAVKV